MNKLSLLSISLLLTTLPSIVFSSHGCPRKPKNYAANNFRYVFHRGTQAINAEKEAAKKADATQANKTGRSLSVKTSYSKENKQPVVGSPEWAKRKGNSTTASTQRTSSF